MQPVSMRPPASCGQQAEAKPGFICDGDGFDLNLEQFELFLTQLFIGLGQFFFPGDNGHGRRDRHGHRRPFALRRRALGSSVGALLLRGRQSRAAVGRSGSQA